MNYRFLFLINVGVFFLGAIFFVFAQSNPFDIQFPVAELGNCNSIEECKIYCDALENQEACIAWAKSQGIQTETKEHPSIPEKGGPGGCTSEEECKTYCEIPDNRLSCIDFGEKEGFMTKEEAERARTFIQKEKEGFSGPGGCDSQESCKEYCQNPDHIEACITHAVENGFMPKEEADRILSFIQEGTQNIQQFGRPHIPSVRQEPEIDKGKVMRLLEEQSGPGGCNTFETCQTFCETPGNENTCLEFATQHNLIPQEEIEKLKKINETEGPGGCRGRQCQVYCEEPGHETECLEFARKNGLIREEEFEKVKKFVDATEKGGPGGCKGRACEQYCNDPTHRDECFAFAKENNLLPKEEIEKIEKIESTLQSGGGPGGCKNEQECRSYCSDTSHFDECAAFGVNAGIMRPEQAKEMLQQFIQIEKFGPQGQFGGRGGTFPLEGGTMPPGFGRGGFPDPSQLPPEFQKEFEERFKQFDQYRQFFEQGQHNGFIPKEGQGIPPEGFHPPEGGFQPQEGTSFGSSPPHEGGFIPPTGEGQIPPEFQQQYQQQYQNYPQQGQYPPPRETYPSDSQYPSDGTYYPPPDGTYPSSGGTYPTSEPYHQDSYTQPPSDGTNYYSPPPGEYTPPPESAPPPTGLRPSLRSLLGNLFAPLLNLLGR